LKTPSERYLARLARVSFFDLWCFPNVYTDEGKRTPNADGRELCDLLVIFEDQIIVFSDKHCEFHTHADLKVSWQRWYRKAILKTVNQLFGAEKWITEHIDRLFLDSKCAQRFPVSLTSEKQYRVHLVAVTRGSAHATAAYFGSGASGSYIVNTSLTGDQHLTTPFEVGFPDSRRRFAHVFDEVSFDLLMAEIDTISDFVAYLSRRQDFLMGATKIFAAGEEELLAQYFLNTDENGHCFRNWEQHYENAVFREGGWREINRGARFSARRETYEQSYFWDSLIRFFIDQLGRTTLDGPRILPMSDLEECVRDMASENRFRRRLLSDSARTVFGRELEPGSRYLRIIEPINSDGRVYVFLAFAAHVGWSGERYSVVRKECLMTACWVAKWKYPESRCIVGLAHEPAGTASTSFDVAVLKLGSEPLSSEELAELEPLRKKWRILEKPIWTKENIDEFPLPKESSRAAEITVPVGAYRPPKLSRRGRKRR
jgi:hypothetical protein